jgi:hypothetical protein
MYLVYKILLLSMIPVLVFAQTNVITNGGLENWTAGVPDGWQQYTNDYDLSQNTDTVYSGTSSAKQFSGIMLAAR